MKNRKSQNRAARALKKSLLSAFLVATFGAYALENRANAAGELTTVVVPTPAGLVALQPAPGPTSVPVAAAGTPAGTTSAASTGVVAAAAKAAPTAAPASAATSSATTASSATAAPTASATAASTAAAGTSSGYNDGTYTGSSVDVRWGYVQVQATIQNGKITNVQFLEYPNERTTSARINAAASPRLQQEAIQAQSANVNIITGATLTSQGFQQSLQVALNQAKG